MVIVLAATSLMTACTKSAPAPATEPDQPSAPAQETASPEVINLKFSINAPATGYEYKNLSAWGDKVKEATQGRVEVTIFPSESLVKQADAYTSTMAGICDISYVSTLFEPGQFSLNNVMIQLAVSPPTDKRGIQLWDELWNEFPEMKEEFSKVKVLLKFLSGGTGLQLTKGKEARVPEDMRGMKIITNVTGVEMLKMVDASPIDLPAPEWYTALERELGEGLWTNTYVMNMFGCTELLPYHLDLGLGAGAHTYIMNLDRWNSLPPDIQKAIEDLAPWWTDMQVNNSLEGQQRVWSKCEELGHTIVRPTMEEFQLWQDVALPSSDKWIETNEAKGKPAQEVFEEARRLSTKYRQQ